MSPNSTPCFPPSTHKSIVQTASHRLLWKYKWDSLLKTFHWLPTSLSKSQSPYNSHQKPHEICLPSTSWPISYISPPCLLCFRHAGLLAVPKPARKAFTFSKLFLPLGHSPPNSWSGCSPRVTFKYHNLSETSLITFYKNVLFLTHTPNPPITAASCPPLLECRTHNEQECFHWSHSMT